MGVPACACVARVCFFGFGCVLTDARLDQGRDLLGSHAPAPLHPPAQVAPSPAVLCLPRPAQGEQCWGASTPTTSDPGGCSAVSLLSSFWPGQLREWGQPGLEDPRGPLPVSQPGSQLPTVLPGARAASVPVPDKGCALLARGSGPSPTSFAGPSLPGVRRNSSRLRRLAFGGPVGVWGAHGATWPLARAAAHSPCWPLGGSGKDHLAGSTWWAPHGLPAGVLRPRDLRVDMGSSCKGGSDC